jgi:hypothetical protein
VDGVGANRENIGSELVSKTLVYRATGAKKDNKKKEPKQPSTNAFCGNSHRTSLKEKNNYNNLTEMRMHRRCIS